MYLGLPPLFLLAKTLPACELRPHCSHPIHSPECVRVLRQCWIQAVREHISAPGPAVDNALGNPVVTSRSEGAATARIFCPTPGIAARRSITILDAQLTAANPQVHPFPMHLLGLTIHQ